MADLIDFIRAEERIKLHSEECRQCECFSCLNGEHEKCRYKCFQRCKKKKQIWIHCKHYESIY